MDSIFFLDEGSRLSFLQTIMQSLGCTYVCLWSYLPKPSNCLVFLDGLYHEAENTHLPSSSSTSMAAKFFNQYRQLVVCVEDGLVPGLSIKGNISCLHLNQSELQSLSSADSQRQFYLAARIKTSIFLGSINGEIELGFSTVISQVNMQMLINNLIPVDFTPRVIPLRSYQNLPSSSSSSLRSLSMENSSESFSILYNFQKTSRLSEPTRDDPLSTKQKTSNTAPPHRLEMDLLAQQLNLQFPTRESEHAAMTNALITVLSSTSSSSSSSSSPQPTADQGHHSGSSSAFKKYASNRPFQKNQTTDGLRRRSMFNRSIEFFRSLNLGKIGERLHGNRPSSYHFHHRILERLRRKKLNENFLALRSLLPPTTKKDRDSVLKAAREKLISFVAEVAELSQKNQTLMAAQGFADKKETRENETNNISNSPTERFSVRITHVLNESPSEGLTVDLQIDLIGDNPLEQLIIRILEFLKQIKNLSLVSMEANVQTTGSTSNSHLTYRLNVKGGEWDEASFEEAITRILSDVAL